MIRLEVEDYCQSCLDFCPDVTKPERVYAGDKEMILSDTIVRCEYRKRCAGIRRFLEHQMKEVEVVG
jgi:hypothetical protein